MAGIQRQAGVRYSVLTPNAQGFEAARPTRPDEIVVFGAASEAFSQKNINCSIAESIERFAPVVQAALAAGIAVRGAMSCTVGCPYEGDIAPERVTYLAGLMKQIGVQRVDVADTIGVGTPLRVQRAIEATLQHFDVDHICGHFHDTYGQALAILRIGQVVHKVVARQIRKLTGAGRANVVIGLRRSGGVAHDERRPCWRMRQICQPTLHALGVVGHVAVKGIGTRQRAHGRPSLIVGPSLQGLGTHHGNHTRFEPSLRHARNTQPWTRRSVAITAQQHLEQRIA
jgi:hypothetical protein